MSFSSAASSRLQTVLRHISPRLHSAQTASSIRRSVTLKTWRTNAPLHSSSSSLHTLPCATFSTHANSNAPLLPPQSEHDQGRLTVVLDMDETLLHSSLTPHPVGIDPRSVDDHADATAASLPDKKPIDFSFIIGDGVLEGHERVRSTLRPGLHHFLYALHQEFEPILFTSALPIYAQPLLDRIEKQVKSRHEGESPSSIPIFRHRLYRSSTVLHPRVGHVKDIRRFGRSMSRIVLIDNSWLACVATPDNSIVVPDYLGEKTDELFSPLLTFLRKIKHMDDVRQAIMEAFKFRQQLDKAGFKYEPAQEDDAE